MVRCNFRPRPGEGAVLGAFLLHAALGQPAGGWRRCVLYLIAIGGLALPAIEVAWRRDSGLVLALAYPVAFLRWDPARFLPAVFPLWAIAWGGGLVLAMTWRGRAFAVAGLLAFWSAQGWLFVSDELTEGGVRSVSVFSQGLFACW